MSLKQKNYRLPVALARTWDQFNGVGSQEKSKNAAGAFFLFMMMPDHIRSICRDLAYEKGASELRGEFWRRLREYENDIRAASAILDAAEAHAQGRPQKKAVSQREFLQSS